MSEKGGPWLRLSFKPSLISIPVRMKFGNCFLRLFGNDKTLDDLGQSVRWFPCWVVCQRWGGAWGEGHTKYTSAPLCPSESEGSPAWLCKGCFLPLRVAISQSCCELHFDNSCKRTEQEHAFPVREHLTEERAGGQRAFRVGRSNGERPEIGGCWGLSLKGRVHPGHRSPHAAIKADLTCSELGQLSTLDFAQVYQSLTY